MSHQLLIVLIMSLAFSLPMEASVDENQIQCSNHAGGGVSSCAVNQNAILAEVQPYESDFLINYKMTCNRNFRGPRPSFIGVFVEGGGSLSLQYNFEGNDLLVGTGMGPLVLRDTKPFDLITYQFKDCQLVFNKIVTRPSAKMQLAWSQTEAAYDALLAEKELKSNEMSRIISKLSSLAGDKDSFNCLVSKSQEDPLLVGIFKDLKSEYENLYGAFESIGTQCGSDAVNSLSLNIDFCRSHPGDLDSYFCVVFDKYSQLEHWYDSALEKIEDIKMQNNQAPELLLQKINRIEQDLIGEQSLFSTYR